MSVNFDHAKVNLENLVEAIRTARFDTVDEAAKILDVLGPHAEECLEDVEELEEHLDSAQRDLQDALASLNEII